MQNEQLLTTLVNMTIGLALVVIVLVLFNAFVKFLARVFAKLDLTDPLTGVRYRDVVDENGRLLENSNESKG